MHLTARQEQFSRSIVYAIASRSGVAISERNVDNDSIDLTLCSKLQPRRPSIDVQLKCTGREVLLDTELRFTLGRKNYDDLRIEELLVPRILIVVLVPSNIEDWLQISESHMQIRHSGYWVSLRGYPVIEEQSKVVAIPRTNLFTEESLTAMLQKIQIGENL